MKQAAETGDYDSVMRYGEYLLQSGYYWTALDWFERAYDKSSGINAGKAAYAISRTYEEIGNWKANIDFMGIHRNHYSNDVADVAIIITNHMIYGNDSGTREHEEADKWLEKAKRLGYHC